MSDRETWVSLPVQGTVLKALAFVGNPKDGEVRIETEGNPLLMVPTHRFEVTFGANVAFRVAVRGLDDVNFEQRILWPLAHRASLATAELAWPLSSEDWNEELTSWSAARKSWMLSAAGELRLHVQ